MSHQLSHLIEYTSAWRGIAELLDHRRSVIVIAPRHYGKWSALQRYAERLSAEQGRRGIIISSRLSSINGGEFSYTRLWESVRSQLGVGKRLKVTTYSSFLSAFQSVLDDTSTHVTIFVGGTGRGHEENHYRALAAFQSLLGTGRVALVGVDDYSCFFYQKQNFLLSDLHTLVQEQIGPITCDEIECCIAELADGELTDVHGVATTIHEQSGGHIGLAQELLRGLEREGWPRGAACNRSVDNLLKSSVVLDLISRALEEDAEGYCRTALEYRSPSCPEQNSPRIHVLRQLGVLQRETPPLLRLCRGAVTKLVAGLRAEGGVATPGRVGTVVSEAGPRIFEEGPVELTDDDLVVLHISDLHVSEKYRHRLTWRGGQMNPNEQSASELLHDDLESLGLLDRVDAMIITGDFVWLGSPNEFRRAQTVVQEMAAEVKLELSRVLLIPGNHDVEWNPGILGTGSYGKAVSRESYDDFIALVTKRSAAEVDVLEVASRSGSVMLQVLGLDSNRVEGPEAAGIGFVARDALTSAKARIANFRSACPPGTRSFAWIAVHHHIFPASSTSLSGAQSGTVTTMANAAEILEYANQFGVEVILHGHEHQPSITVARRWPVDIGDVFKPVASIGAGSFGVAREYLGPFSRNHYYVIVRRPDGILIRSRQQGTGGVKFVAHSDIWLPR